MSQADHARGTLTLPVASSTSTSTTVAPKLKMPICGNGRPIATVRFGSTVFWSNTHEWVPMIGPPAAQCARPEIAREADAALLDALDRDLAARARSSRSSIAHSSISLACALSFFSTSAAAATTERPVT